MIILALILISYPVSAAERAVSAVYDATISPTCAPFDGPAISIVFQIDPAQKFSATVWSQGVMQALHDGKTFTLAIDNSDTGDGRANICAQKDGKDDCTGVVATIKLPADDTQGSVSVKMNDGTNREFIYYVLPHPSKEKPGFCG